jgi:hypothetical protein
MPGLINYTIQRSRVPAPAGNPAIGYRLVVTCTAFNGGPDTAIFCFKKISESAAVFSHVASYADMEEYAVGVPTPETDAVFFRLSTADLVFRSPELLEETLTLMLQDFEILTTGLDVTSVLSTVETGAVPAAADALEGSYTISFPTAFSMTPRVFVSVTPPVAVTVTPSAVGFVLTAGRVLTDTDLVEWHAR